MAHKLLRLVGPFCLVAALVLSLFLPGPLYVALLVAQVAFYGAAVAGWLGGRRVRVPLLKLPYYFCMINAAYVVGLARLLTGRERVQWNAPRACAAGKGA